MTSFLKYKLGVLAFKCVKGLALVIYAIDSRHVLVFMTAIPDINLNIPA